MERELNGWKNVKVNIYWTNKHIDKNHIGNKSNTRNKNVNRETNTSNRKQTDKQKKTQFIKVKIL